MATNTTNYNLVKPSEEEFYDVRVNNNNMDILDELLFDLNKDKVDKIEGKGLSTNDFTTTLKDKLAGIESGATKYTHPATHDPAIIKQDKDNRFISDIELAQIEDNKKGLIVSNTQIAANRKQIASHVAESATIKHKAKEIGLEDTANKFTAVNVEGAMNELFTNVSNGKQLVGNAITGVDDSVVIPTDPSFGDLAGAIGGISTGRKWSKGTVRASGDKVIVTGLEFAPSLIVCSSRGYAEYSWRNGPTAFVGKKDGFIGYSKDGGSKLVNTIGLKGGQQDLYGVRGNITIFKPDGFEISHNGLNDSHHDSNFNWIAYE